MMRGRQKFPWIVAAGLSLLFASSSCRKEEPSASSTETPDTGTKAKNDQKGEIKVGDEVIVESGKGTFWFGKVTKEDGSTITYEYGNNKSSGDAQRDKVYVIDPNHKTVAEVDSYAVCQTGTNLWNSCQIKAIQGAVYVGQDVWGKTHNLSAGNVVVPNHVAQANIKEQLAKQGKNREFVTAAKAAGKPKREMAWKPTPGQQVVALFAGASWYSGKILRVTPTSVEVAWDDKTSPSKRSYDEVAPLPEGPHEVAEGQFVIVRPRNGTRWDFHRVEKIEGDSVLVVDKDDRRRKVRSTDLLPLVR